MKKQISKKLEQVLRRKSGSACGTYPGANRARTFQDKKKSASRKACRNWQGE